MADREALVALAERVERVTGPDRELDWLIAEAVGEVPVHSIRTIGFDYDWYRKPDEWTLWRAKDSEGRSVETWTPKKRTASLDAAMTLVDENAFWRLGNDPADFKATVTSGDGRAVDFDFHHAVAATPALALTAASLRALASKEAPHG